MRSHIKGWLSLAFLFGCARDPAIEPEIDPACEDAAELLEYCLGGASDEFFAACQADPARAEELVAAECPPTSGKADGWIGWKDRGERCWFNWECDGDLICRPLEPIESDDQACLDPGTELGTTDIDEYCGDWCDDDDDCASGLLCRNQDDPYNGMCVSVDHEVDSHVQCAVEFH